MSFDAMSWATKQATEKTSDRLILLHLASMANQDGICWPSYQYLADVCGLSRRTVIYAIDRLVEAGFLSVEKRRRDDGLNRSNVYKLSIKESGANSAPYGANNALGGANAAPLSGANSAPRNSHSLKLSMKQGLDDENLENLAIGQLIDYAVAFGIEPMLDDESYQQFVERLKSESRKHAAEKSV